MSYCPSVSNEQECMSKNRLSRSRRPSKEQHSSNGNTGLGPQQLWRGSVNAWSWSKGHEREGRWETHESNEPIMESVWSSGTRPWKIYISPYDVECFVSVFSQTCTVDLHYWAGTVGLISTNFPTADTLIPALAKTWAEMRCMVYFSQWNDWQLWGAPLYKACLAALDLLNQPKLQSRGPCIW